MTVYIVVRLLPTGGGQIWSGSFYYTRATADDYIARQPAKDRDKLISMELLEGVHMVKEANRGV